MPKDWDAVASVISTRMAELDMTQQELASRAGVALQTVRELQHNLVPRKRTPRTLETMSTALGLSSSHLGTVLEGGSPPNPDESDPVLAELDEIKRTLTTITERLDAIEHRQGVADDSS